MFREPILSITPLKSRLDNLSPDVAQRIFSGMLSHRHEILTIHGGRCFYCGFEESEERIRRYAEKAGTDSRNFASQITLMPPGGHYAEIEPDSFIPVCVFCRAACELDTVEHPDAWAVALLPGVSQTLISWLARICLFHEHVTEEMDDMRGKQMSISAEEYAAASNFALMIDRLSKAVGGAVSRAGGFGPSATTFLNFRASLEWMQRHAPESYEDRQRLLTDFKIVPKFIYSSVGPGSEPFNAYRASMLEGSDFQSFASFYSTVLCAREVYSRLHVTAFGQPERDGQNG